MQTMVLFRVRVVEINSTALQPTISWVRLEDEMGALQAIPDTSFPTIVVGPDRVPVVIEVITLEVAVLTNRPSEISVEGHRRR